MKRRHLSITTKYIIAFCALLLAVSVALGALLMSQSGETMRKMIRKHMISVANTAAASIDGDVLESFTAEDVGSEEYKHISQTLETIKNIQQDSDIKYIYTIKRDGDHYVFTVDPDPLRPAAFGKKVVYTPEQDKAWSGVATVDSEAVEDEWGCFYTAWSPVRNSSGEVVGIIGVDFAADSFDENVANHIRSVIIVSIVSLVSGVLIVMILAGQFSKRFRSLHSELEILSDDLEELSKDIEARPGYEEKAAPIPDGTDNEDMVGALCVKIRLMHQKLKEYIGYIHEQAYTDTMTGTGNKTAYLDRIRELNREINSGTADFAIAVFDINGLKITNDNYGHECGDRIISDSASIIRRIFPDGQIYRIGGDEFIEVLKSVTEEQLSADFAKLDDEVEKFNSKEKHYAMTLSFSHGGAVYRPGSDADFKEVFKRADKDMYKNKGNYYRKYGFRPNQYGDE